MGTSRCLMHVRFLDLHAAPVMMRAVAVRSIHDGRGDYGFCDYAQNDGNLIIGPR